MKNAGRRPANCGPFRKAHTRGSRMPPRTCAFFYTSIRPVRSADTFIADTFVRQIWYTAVPVFCTRSLPSGRRTSASQLAGTVTVNTVLPSRFSQPLSTAP